MSTYTIALTDTAEHGEDNEWEDIDADDDDTAVSAAQEWATRIVSAYRLDDPDGYAYDLILTVVDEDGDEIYRRAYAGSAAAEAKDDMVETWDVRGEYETEYLGIDRDGDWYTWTENGGTRGSFDRTCGDGVWRERPEMPTPISETEAVAWFTAHDILRPEWATEDE